MRALIVAGGVPPSESLLRSSASKSDLILAADAGFCALYQLGIVPDMLIGDMDSLGNELADVARDLGSHILRVPSKKNSTDTELAVEEAARKGATEILLLGATGGRVDHLLGNLMLLRLGEELGAPVTIEDELQTILYVRYAREIHGSAGQTVSIIPADKEAVVRASGLEYPLEDLLLTNARPRGISNVMLSDCARIETDAPLYVCLDKTADAFSAN